LATDDHARARRVDDHVHLVGLALDLDVADTGLVLAALAAVTARTIVLVQRIEDHGADLTILVKLLCVLLAGGKPATLVLFDDSQAEADGIYFATQVNL